MFTGVILVGLPLRKSTTSSLFLAVLIRKPTGTSLQSPESTVCTLSHPCLVWGRLWQSHQITYGNGGMGSWWRKLHIVWRGMAPAQFPVGSPYCTVRWETKEVVQHQLGHVGHVVFHSWLKTYVLRETEKKKLITFFFSNSVSITTFLLIHVVLEFYCFFLSLVVFNVLVGS